ncbi:hypothetical protein MesoLjLc_12610 [Mesorhizobium sp. L-8-10]|uniref:DUF924 family protein n=1 Tax=Mesorhizobium sp. L-8-10 TaxID=2744523 RepID=UPI00192602A5|nr:DUF924 family protein [Mesorhizobium sp. L-8-10]BCH29331.1 hypothetical protein MesoLjLc_12610 [Mesorhizobium sp. L-8-10]
MPETPGTDSRIDDVVDFWARSRTAWFAHDPEFDERFRQTFAALYETARSGVLAHWEDTADGCLALLVLLDQYPRNAFRGTPRMYESDDEARRIARRVVDRDFVRRVSDEMRLFMILPFAHSETLEDQDLSVNLHRRFLPAGLGRARRHRAIVERFGRFPHRNPILGRASRPEEQRYLAAGGFQG